MSTKKKIKNTHIKPKKPKVIREIKIDKEKGRYSFMTEIKKMLEQEKNELIKRLSDNSQVSDIDASGDETDEIQGRILALASTQIVERAKQKLNQIENALSRIELKTFGDCVECGEQIADKRLRLLPCVSTCIGCAENLEFARKQTR